MLNSKYEDKLKISRVASFWIKSGDNALVIGFPEGGGGARADVGEYGDFMGTLL